MAKKTTDEKIKELRKKLRKLKVEFEDAQYELEYAEYKAYSLEDEINKVNAEIVALKVKQKK